MYLSKIDDLIEKILDDFYSTINKNNIVNKILGETNYVKFQKEINDIFKNYINGLNMTSLKEDFKNTEVKNKIIEVIKKYIAVYLFLYIGYFYTNSDSTYVNNIVEFTKNQPSYDYKVQDFFNSSSNAFIIKYYQFLKQIVNFLDAKTVQQKDVLKNRTDYKESIQFITGFGDEFIKTVGDINEKHMKAHTLIQTIIVFNIYKNEKKDLFKLLEILNSEEGEFIFIDVVMPTRQVIDFRNIELLLTKKEIIKGLAYTLWDYLKQYDEQMVSPDKSVEEKIDILFSSGVILPIVDDFLLFHKDTERYDNFDDKNKQKEDTKIRYIINKIDSSINIDKNNKNEVKKYFYQPLMNKRAVTVNNYEDMKIINKFINKGNISIENAEFLRELENATVYPYINFKESDNSFMFSFNKTIDIPRFVNFEQTSDYKQKRSQRLIMRVGSEDMMLNIRGVFIPSTTSTYCNKNKNLVDIKKVTDSNNGYELSLSFLDDALIQEKKHKKSVYWLFDTATDKADVEVYEQKNKMTNQDIIKHTLSVLYDELVTMIYDEILNRCKTEQNKIDIDSAITIMNKYLNNKIDITKDKLIKEKLQDEIFDKVVIRRDLEYDTNDDKVTGLAGEIIKLPKFEELEDKDKVIIRVSTEFIKEKGIYEEKELIQGVCQHNITWDRLSELKKTDQKMFADELYSFLQTYVVENVDNDYVCRSCGFYLNIKKYVQDGKFDDESKKFIVMGMPLDKPLEDIPEYEKYKGSIRSIDKLLEKVSLVSNISYFVGLSPTVKSRRKIIIKDVIDIVLENNKMLKKGYKDRNNNISKKYSITNSNLFVFDLDNSIFIFSSKDKDFLKPIKQNNVIGYMMFIMMLDLNESQISYINSDKKGFCNFQIFDKVYQSLFGDLKFLKNNKGDTVLVKNYVIFCYILYMLACYASKYSIWYYDFKEDAKDKAKRQKLQPVIQKIIIHTVVDIINSVIENSHQSKSNIYEILSVKFYNKLNTTFSNKELYNKFKEQYKTVVTDEKSKTTAVRYETVKLTGEYLPKSYLPPHHWRKCYPSTMYMDILPINKKQQISISNITSCETGNFHQWSYTKPDLECKICKLKISDLKLDNSTTEKLLKKYNLIKLENLATKYCLSDGTPHSFSVEENIRVCTKCKNKYNHKYSSDELNKLNNKLEEYKKSYIEKTLKLNETIQNKNKENLTYKEKLYEKISKQYEETVSKNKDNIKFINELITIIENNSSQDLNKLNINLIENIYILDHDYLGNSLDKPVQLVGTDKIHYKENYQPFNTNVIYYNHFKNGKIDVFYDAEKHILLGYKEENKQVVLAKNNKLTIKINYSLLNKIKQLGCVSANINLLDVLKDNEKEYIQEVTLKNKDKKELIKSVIRERHNNLSNIIYKFIRMLHRIINGHTTNIITNEQEKEFEQDYFTNKYDLIVNKYHNKLTNIVLTNKEPSEHKVFKHWKGVLDITVPDDKITVEDTDIVTVDKLNKIDSNGVLLIYYFVDELVKLIQYNNDKSVKSSLCLFIIDFINIVFETYNTDKYKEKSEYKQFYYFIHSATYVDEVKDVIGETEGVYEELVDENKEMTDEEKEAMQDLIEEQDAMDIEGDEIDYESGYQTAREREPNEYFLSRISEMSYKEYSEILSIYDEYKEI